LVFEIEKKGRPEMPEINKKYPVNTAVWIATALLSAEVFDSNPACGKKDMYFKQTKISTTCTSAGRGQCGKCALFTMVLRR